MKLPDNDLNKVMTLQHLLVSVNTRFKAEIAGEVTSTLSSDWRYLQHYMSPEWLVHFAVETAWRPDVGYHLGVLVHRTHWIIIEIDEPSIRSWLDDNISKSDASVDEALDVVASYLKSTIKSQGGRAKAQRLIDELKSMSRARG